VSAPADYDVLRGLLPPADQHSGDVRDTTRVPEPWESGMQATCECLSWRGALYNADRRRAEDELGETVYADFPAYSRSALVVAHMLLEKGILDQEELRTRMGAVRARLEMT
jgi:Nitrile hydratase beta subunit